MSSDSIQKHGRDGIPGRAFLRIRCILDLLSPVWEDDYVPDAWPDWMQVDRDVKLVAELDGKVVGVCHAGRLSDDECWFNGIRVDPAFHRRGIGTALTNATIEAARSRGYRHALLGIDPDNTASLEMTARTGFVRIADYSKLAGPSRPDVAGPRLRTAAPAECRAFSPLRRRQAVVTASRRPPTGAGSGPR